MKRWGLGVPEWVQTRRQLRGEKKRELWGRISLYR